MQLFKWAIILLFSILLVHISMAQRKLVKVDGSNISDDLQGRFEFEVLRLKDPATNKIPMNARAMELNFMLKKESFIRRIQSIPSAVGDIRTEWYNRGPYNIGGRTRALAIDNTNDNIFLAGGVSGGVWRTTNQGSSWTKTTGANDLQSVTAIAQDTRVGATATWYYGTGEMYGNSASASDFSARYYGDGIYKSTNGGVSWTLLTSTSSNSPQTLNTFDYIHELSVNPQSGVIYAATHDGIWSSSNGGDSWTEELAGNFSTWSDISITTTGKVYAFQESGGIFTSVNDGASWESITPSGFPLSSGDRKEIAIAPSNENIVYIIGENGNNHALWKYDASTLSWIDLSVNIPHLGGTSGDFNSQSGYDLLIKVKPDDADFVVIGGTNLFRSTDGFSSTLNTTWIGGYTPANNSFATYPNHHPDQHALVFFPSSPNKAISGNDGGLQITNDISSTLKINEAVKWTPLNNGYLTSQVYAVSIGPDNQLMAGFQDNSTWLSLSTESTATWTNQYGGDGGYNAIASNASYRYLSYQRGNILRAIYPNEISSQASSITAIDPTGFNHSSSLFISPLYIDPYNNEILYLGGNSTFFINSQVTTATTTTGWTGINVGATVSEIGVSSDNQVFIGTENGEIFRISDPVGTATISSISSGLPVNAFVSGIAVNQLNALEILVTFSNYGVRSVWHTINGGSNWADVSGNLEENPNGAGSGPSVRCAMILGNGERYLVGTSTGLYTTTSLNGLSTNWERETVLGANVVEHMAARQEDGVVVVGTHGNGVFTATYQTAQSMISVKNQDIIYRIQNSPDYLINLDTIFNSTQDPPLSLSYALSNNSNISLLSTSISTSIMTVSFQNGASGFAELNVEASDTDGNKKTTKFEFKVFGVESNFPVVESFETESSWFGEKPWSRGVPSDNFLNAASNGTNVWGTNLSSNYPNNTTGRLFSPLYDFRTISNPVLSFDIKFDTEEDYDGIFLGYRTNFTKLEFDTIPPEAFIFNGYQLIKEQNIPGWNGNSGSFKRVVLDITSLNVQDTVQFAFFFISDLLVNKEGVLIDYVKAGGGFTDLLLSTLSTNENNSPGSTIATISSSGGLGNNAYQLVSGIGSTSNEKFLVESNILKSGVTFHHETSPSHNIRLSVIDEDGNSLEQSFNIKIENIFLSPTNVTLSGDTIKEGAEVGTVIGNFIMLDPDTDSTNLTIELVDGTGAEGNTNFYIEKNQLKNKIVFDFETVSTYNIRVRLKDNHLNFIEKIIRIKILDVEGNEPPTGISISNNSIKENQLNGILIGLFTTTDIDDINHTYTFTTGINQNDNSFFKLTDNQLLSNTVFDYEYDSIYDIIIRSTDGGNNSISEHFEIKVLNSNDPPTYVNISDSVFGEHIGLGVSILSFMTTDVDDDTHIYNLVPGQKDNSSFLIRGNQLIANDKFDYETKSSYEINIVSYDPDSASVGQYIKLYVVDQNDPPIQIFIRDTIVKENNIPGYFISLLQTLDQDDSTHIYLLKESQYNNDDFFVSKDSLFTKKTFDYESKSIYDLLITSQDDEGGSLDALLHLKIEDVNDKPIDISLSNNLVKENDTIGALIGKLFTEDQDDSVHIYSLITGESVNNNDLFSITEGKIYTQSTFDFEENAYYTLRVKSSDDDNASIEKDFLISIIDINDPPFDIQLSNNSIRENNFKGDFIGSFLTLDQDSDHHTYYLNIDVKDNNFFELKENKLLAAQTFDYEEATNYDIEIKSTDDRGDSFIKEFSIDILDEDDGPTGLLSMADMGIRIFPNPSDGEIIISIINNYQGLIRVGLLDVTGKEIENTEITKGSQKLRKNLSLHHLTSGTYYFIIQQSNDFVIERIIIAK